MQELKLFESIRLEAKENSLVLDIEPHLSRLGKSAQELGFDFNKNLCRQELEKSLASTLKPGLYKLKIILERTGLIETQIEPYLRFRDPNYILRVRILDPQVYHSQDPLIYKHKSSLRPDLSAYLQDVDELIWLNKDGWLAEGSYTNIFWEESPSLWRTPSLETGILAGTMRAKLLANPRDTQYSNPSLKDIFQKIEQIEEGFYPVSDLLKAPHLVLSNALLGPRLAKLVECDE